MIHVCVVYEGLQTLINELFLLLQISQVLSQVPESQIYLLYTYSKKKPVTGGKHVKFEIHQNIMEAILTTMLSQRQSSVREHDNQCKSSTGVEQAGSLKPSHPVYLFDSRTLGQFYNISIQGEPLHCGQYVQKWYGQDNGPLEGLVLPKHTLDSLSKHDQLAKCILMADIFCRSVSKFSKLFPMAYS